MECVVRIVNLFLLAYCLLPVRLPLSVYLLLFLHLLLLYEVVAHIE